MIFSRSEIEQRQQALLLAMDKRDIDGVFLSSPDHVYYISGVPLLSAWGRPLFAVLGIDGRQALIGAAIERETMERHSFTQDIRCYGDDENVFDSSLAMVADYLREGSRPYRRIGVEMGCLSVVAYEKLRACFPQVEFVDISPDIYDIRIIKSPEEQKILGLACQLAEIGMAASVSAIVEHTSELNVVGYTAYEVAKALAALYTQEDGGASSCYSYCQFGDHSMIPHQHATKRILRRGQVVALNMFPIVWGYCSTLQRTYIYGEPSPEQLRALKTVTVAGQLGRNAVQAGAVPAEIDKLCYDYMRDCGYQEEYFRHGSGHGQGILIGAAGREEQAELRAYNRQPLRPGMMISVEPALYIPGLGGFRHSDVLLIEEGGAVALTSFTHDIGGVM